MVQNLINLAQTNESDAYSQYLRFKQLFKENNTNFTPDSLQEIVNKQTHISRNTFLHYAAYEGEEGMVKFLIQSGANTNLQNSDGQTAFHIAIEQNRELIVRVLIEAGTDLNQQDMNGDTALHIAAENGNEGMVQLLIASGADINAKNFAEETPLYSAAAQGYENIVEHFIETKKVDWTRQADEDGNTPLHIALSRGHMEVAKLLMSYLRKLIDSRTISRKLFYPPNQVGDTPLHFAVAQGYLPIVQHLIDERANLQCRDLDGNTLLHIAAAINNMPIVKFLIEKNPLPIHDPNNDGKTPLHVAVENNNIDVAKYLISIRKDTNYKTQDLKGHTLLHTASMYGYQELLELLVTHFPILINKENIDGYTPLHFAVEQGYLSIVQHLIDKGANLQYRGLEGNTLLHIASVYGHQELVELLVTRFPILINQKNGDGYTPLHFAVEQGHLGIVENLISKGAAAVNVDGLTPLDIAILSDQKEIALFLSSKPDFNSCSAENGIKLNKFQRIANSPSLAGRSSVDSNISSLLSPIFSPGTFNVVEDDIGNLFGDNSNGQPITPEESNEKINELIKGFEKVGKSTSMSPEELDEFNELVKKLDGSTDGSPAGQISKPGCNEGNRAKLNEFQFQNIQQEIIIPNHVESSHSDTSISSPVSSTLVSLISNDYSNEILPKIDTSTITPICINASELNKALVDITGAPGLFDDLPGPNSSFDEYNEIAEPSKRQRTC